MCVCMCVRVCMHLSQIMCLRMSLCESMLKHGVHELRSMRYVRAGPSSYAGAMCTQLQTIVLYRSKPRVFLAEAKLAS